MHCPSEHFLSWYQDDMQISLVPHLHWPSVHVSVAPEQSSSTLHPVVIRIMYETFIAHWCFNRNIIMVLFQIVFTFHVNTHSFRDHFVIKQRRFRAECKTTGIIKDLDIKDIVFIKDTLTIGIIGARRLCAQGTCITSIVWPTIYISYLFVS